MAALTPRSPPRPLIPPLLATLALLFLLGSSQRHAALALNPVLDVNGTYPYLVDKASGRLIEPRDYMDFESIYAPNETYKARTGAAQRAYHLLKAFDFANYYQADYWHYSSARELSESALPVANGQVCAEHLDWLERQLNDSQRTLFAHGEQHMNLMQLVDSFGRPEASTFLGHGYWLGSHYQCTRAAVDLARYAREQSELGPLNVSKSLMRNRYCVGKARDKGWPTPAEDNYVPVVSYKVGLCLPEACETLSFGRHKRQLERIMLHQAPAYWRERLYLHDLYCLPDPRSPVRALPLATRLFLALLGGWLMLVVFATGLYSCFKRHQRDLRHIMRASEHIHLQQKQPPTQPTKMVPDDAPPQTALAAAATAALAATANNNNNQVQLAAARETLGAARGLDVASGNGQPGHLSDENEAAANSFSVNSFIERSNNALTNGVHLLQLIKPNSSETTANNPLQNHSDSHQAKERQSCSSLSNSTCSDSTSSSLALWLSESPLIIKLLQALSIKENMREFRQPPPLLRDPHAAMKLRINLNALDAIKCLCCVLVIFGHIVFIHMQHLTNISKTIELSYELYPRFLIAFFNFVDTFFIMSGLLTAYFIFKRFDRNSFANPMLWLQISLLRLLRLSPVYVLTFWFAKTVTVHLMDGPLWDYGTDKGSIKGLCANDHWWKSILYLGNYNTMQPLCILPAWSIIVDSQYSIIVPPILFLILRYRRLGYVSLLVAVVISTANMSHQLATQTAVKTSDMAKIRLHVYPLISRFAAEFYNAAWNRIGPVAIGILAGHSLYLYDAGVIRRWPWFMRGPAFKFILIMHAFIFVLPTIGRFTDNPKAPSTANGPPEPADMFIFVLSNATIKPIWSFINTILLLRLITDLRSSSVLARLMSHNLWHCLGKLCFASYLIHYEIILIMLKSREDGLMAPSWSNVMREFSYAFLTSSILAYFVYILYEAPINKLVTLLMAGGSHKKPDRGRLEAGAASKQLASP